MVVARDNAQCSTRRALFSQGNSLEKGRERRQQHVRSVDGCRTRCNGSDIFGDDVIRVRRPRRSEPTVRLGHLSSREVLSRVAIIQALSRPIPTRARPPKSVALQNPARAGSWRAADPENPARLRVSRAGAWGVTNSENPARLGVSRAGSWRATDPANLARLRVSRAGARRVTDSEDPARQGVSQLPPSRAKSPESFIFHTGG